jgi:hypothetical protein
MNDRRAATIGGWMGIGVGIGVALGVAMDNLAVWTPIGLLSGLIIGAGIASKRNGDA